MRKIVCKKDCCKLQPKMEVDQRGGGGFLTEYNPQTIKSTTEKQKKVQRRKSMRPKDQRGGGGFLTEYNPSKQTVKKIKSSTIKANHQR